MHRKNFPREREKKDLQACLEPFVRCKPHIFMRCIRGSRCIPTIVSQMSQHPPWGDGAGLSLFYVPVGEQQTYVKMEQKIQREKNELNTRDKYKYLIPEVVLRT